MKQANLSLLIAAALLAGCSKNQVIIPQNGAGNNNVYEKKILVDATKDGGVWWFPQGANGFNPANEHQGKALADYLRGLGYKVDELGRGETITKALLDQYNFIIRASAFFDYTNAEIDAYSSFLNRKTSLLLVTDHLQNTVNDRLSKQLGLNFEGVYWGPVTNLQPHAVTNNTSSLQFMAGAVIKNWGTNITVLGSINGFGALGVVNHPNSKIFFLGDLNGIEQVPQPFTSNLVKWLFE